MDTDKVFMIDGRMASKLYLNRNKVYRFEIKIDLTKDYPQQFFFTTDPAGGPMGDGCSSGWEPPRLSGTPAPLASGFMDVKFTKDHPDVFYYQSKEHKFNGGHIFLRD